MATEVVDAPAKQSTSDEPCHAVWWYIDGGGKQRKLFCEDPPPAGELCGHYGTCGKHYTEITCTMCRSVIEEVLV